MKYTWDTYLEERGSRYFSEKWPKADHLCERGMCGSCCLSDYVQQKMFYVFFYHYRSAKTCSSRGCINQIALQPHRIWPTFLYDPNRSRYTGTWGQAPWQECYTTIISNAQSAIQPSIQHHHSWGPRRTPESPAWPPSWSPCRQAADHEVLGSTNYGADSAGHILQTWILQKMLNLDFRSCRLSEMELLFCLMFAWVWIGSDCV